MYFNSLKTDAYKHGFIKASVLLELFAQQSGSYSVSDLKLKVKMAEKSLLMPVNAIRLRYWLLL